MIGTKRASDNVIFHAGSKLFVLVWNTDSVGRISWAKQNIEETVELAFSNKPDIANRHGGILPPTWLPKCVSVGRILDREVMAKDVVMGHCRGPRWRN